MGVLESASFTCLGGILGASIERVAKTEAHTQKTIHSYPSVTTRKQYCYAPNQAT